MAIEPLPTLPQLLGGKTNSSKNKKTKGNPTGKLSGGDLSLLQFVGTATPGTNKEQRSRDIVASSILGGRDFTNIPSSGGFTVLGKNAFGQDIARSNVTGRVATVDAFNPIDATARALGKQSSPTAIAHADDNRRRVTEKSTNKKKKPTVGTESILGTQSILG